MATKGDKVSMLRAEGNLPTDNKKSDAPTIYADAVQGVMISPDLVKISFIEHFLTDDLSEVRGRYVANLAMPTPQLAAMGALFIRLAAEAQPGLDAAKAQGQ